MTADAYAGAAAGWDAGASLVYAPIVAELVRASPHSLAGHLVLDAGAGTGVATAPLREAAARIIAADVSLDMLWWQRADRPPAVAADLRALPFPDAAVDDVVAAFVLNHLTDPVAGLVELRRVTRPGGAVLAAVFASAFRSALRERVDAVAADAGWRPPDWYVHLKEAAVPLLGTAAAMGEAAAEAGLGEVAVAERPVDVGVDRAVQLVAYRLGQAPFAVWLDEIGPDRREGVRRAAVAAVGPDMQPYRPVVVFLVARAPARRR